MFEAIGQALTLARNTRADLERRERQIVNTTSPINRLPNESLTAIFEEVMNFRPATSLAPKFRLGQHHAPTTPHMLAVYQHWWDVAITSPTLWNCITINDSSIGRITESMLEEAAHYLRRSKSVPITLQLYSHQSAPLGESHSIAFKRAIRLVALLHSHSFRYKTFHCSLYSWEFARLISLSLAPPYSSMTYVYPFTTSREIAVPPCHW